MTQVDLPHLAWLTCSSSGSLQMVGLDHFWLQDPWSYLYQGQWPVLLQMQLNREDGAVFFFFFALVNILSEMCLYQTSSTGWMSEGTVRVCLICSKCLDKPSSACLCCLPVGVIWPLSIYVRHMTQRSIKKRERERKKDIWTRKAKHLNAYSLSQAFSDKFQLDIVTESDGTLWLKQNALYHMCNRLT